MGLFGSGTRESSPQDRVDLDHLTRRVAALEATVVQLQQQLAGSTASVETGEPAYLDQVRALKARGKLIHAIKVYREATGVDLRTAKQAVESLV